ncbi:hypothetical protein AB0P28_08030 [Pseudarthrobacter sp. NPDC089323]
MDTFFWVILIVVAVGIVWWLLNRSNSTKSQHEPTVTNAPRSDGALSSGGAAPSAEAAGTTGIATAAGFGRPAEPAAPTTADEPAPAPVEETPRRERSGAGSSAATPAGADDSHGSAGGTSHDERRHQDQAEWETQWSEAGGSPSARTGSAAASHTTPEAVAPAAPHGATEQSAAEPARPVHHPEYTEPHAPTLPGAETAAVEEADDAGTPAAARTGATGTPSPATQGTATQGTAAAGTTPAATGPAVPAGAAEAETLDRAQSSALVETGADHDVQDRGPGEDTGAGYQPEAAGHLAAAEPYGAGSAAAGPDGAGPAGFEVKGDAGAMVYYEEGHPDFGETRADVWFESAAHAEAAGFRAPRRKRL